MRSPTRAPSAARGSGWRTARFGRRTAASVTGFLSYLTSDSSQPGSNLFGGAEIAVRRQLSRRFQLGFAYRYWQNAGAFSGDDLRQNRGMLTLSYRH